MENIHKQVFVFSI